MERFALLEEAVESALAQPETLEVILVIDHNDMLFKRGRNRWPNLVILENDAQSGLSGARNTGIAAAAGEIVAFLDDDARGSASWLKWLVAPFDDSTVAGVGGRADPVWPTSAPNTLPSELLWIVGCSYTGLPTERAAVRNVIGCSMAFRREYFVELGGFSLDAGRVGALPLGCEETEFCIRLQQADVTARVVYEPRSVVHHTVAADRVRWSYIARRSYFEGISKAALSRRVGTASSLSAESSYLVRVLPPALVRELAHVGRGGVTRGAAIITSVLSVVTGYLVGRLRARSMTAAVPDVAVSELSS
jgi:GT2 family glycosyltransferase